MPSQCVIHESKDWRVTSYGHGWAYLVEDVPGKRSLFMQDEQAATFRQCWEDVERTHPDWTFGDIFCALGFDEALTPDAA